MAGFGHTTRKHPRSRNRKGSGWGSSRPKAGGRPDSATLGIIGVVCAVAGFFVLGIVLGPVAIICGWLAMGRRWSGTRQMPALIAVVLGAIDTLLAVVWMAGTTGNGGMLF